MTKTTANQLQKAKEMYLFRLNQEWKCFGQTGKTEQFEYWLDYDETQFNGFIDYMYFLYKFDDTEMGNIRDWAYEERRKVQYDHR